MAVAARLRHELARRRWLSRSFVLALVTCSLWGVYTLTASVEAERARWGDTVAVLVAAAEVAPGAPLQGVVGAVEFPRSVVPDRALATDAIDPATVARRRIAAGAIVSDLDVVADASPQVLLAADEVAVAVTERIASGARVGDPVMVTTEGVVLAASATVVGTTDQGVLVAVGAAEAAMVAAAAAGPGGVSLLLKP